MKPTKILGLVVSLAVGVLTVVSSVLQEKNMTYKIQEEVQKALTSK